MAGDTFLACMLSPCTFLIGSPRGSVKRKTARGTGLQPDQGLLAFSAAKCSGDCFRIKESSLSARKASMLRKAYAPNGTRQEQKSAICFSRWRLCRLTDKDSIDDSAARQKNMKNTSRRHTDRYQASKRPRIRPRGPHPHGPARAGRGPGSARLPAGRAGPRSCAPAARPWPVSLPSR